MKKYDVVSIGGATRDIIFYTDQGEVISTPQDLTRQKMISFEYGAKLISREVKFGTGGGGCNTAVCLSRLGLKTANFVAIGEDTEGKKISETLKKEKVDTDFIEKKKEAGTGFSLLVIDEKSKEHVAFLYRGANDKLELKKNLKKVNTDWFYMSSLSGKNWKMISDKVIERIKGDGCRLAWNPGETQLQAGMKAIKDLLAFTNVLILNKDESIELVLENKGKIKDIKKPETLLKEIQSWGPDIFVLTDGRQGSYAYDGKKVYYSEILDTKVMDTTGAGDCFGSSFVAGLNMFKGDIEKSIKLGIYNTSSLVTKPGAQNGLLYKKDLKKYFKK